MVTLGESVFGMVSLLPYCTDTSPIFPQSFIASPYAILSGQQPISGEHVAHLPSCRVARFRRVISPARIGVALASAGPLGGIRLFCAASTPALGRPTPF